MGKKILFVTSCLMLLAQTVTADILSAKIDKLETVHNVYENGEKGMRICADITVLGKGNFSMITYFSDSNGNPLPGSGNYASGNGKLYTSKKVLCLLDYSNKKVEAFIPYSVFPKTPGTHGIRCQVYLYDNTKKVFLNNNNFKQVSFNLTNPDNKPSVNTNNSVALNSNNSVAYKPNRVKYDTPPDISECYLKTPDGKHVIKFKLSFYQQAEVYNYLTRQYQKDGPSGYSIWIEPLGIYTLWAKLETYPDYFYFKEYAYVVKLARDLSWVEFLGIRYSQVATISEYNQFKKSYSDLQRALNITSPYTPNYTPSNGSSNNGNSTGSNGNSRANCTRCGGRGVNPTPSAGGGLQSWVAYFNSSGTQCPYCGQYYQHYHDKCSSCSVPSY